MQKITKILIAVLIAALVLLVSTVGILYFAFDIDIFDRSGWKVTEEGQSYYLDYYGDPMLDWQMIEENWYYFDPDDGVMQTGWLELDGRRYYLDENGIRASGWLELPEGTYYISPTNGSVTTGWLEQSEGRYYLGEDGLKVTGWLDLDQNRYYLDESGIASTGWMELDGSRYFLDETGAMCTGWMDTDAGRIYLNETTGAVTIGWLDTDEGRYYFREDGTMATGWTDTPEGLCYLEENGHPATGWMDTEEGRYYLNESGVATVGWLDLEDNRYYFHEDGTMAIGQVTIDEVNHYFTSTGAYVVLVNKWNPVPEGYTVNKVNYKGWEVDASCYDALVEMLSDLGDVGYYKITSAYRSEATQQYIWNNRLQGFMNSGYSRANAEAQVALSVAVPGTSEHHLGLAIDISAGTKVHNWLAENSWQYGFILRYPEGKTEVTGIIYEPWHYRYVGQELAKELFDLGLCMEEYMTMLTEQNQ